MTYNYQIQNVRKQYTYTCVFICHMRTSMDPEFSPEWWAVRIQLVEKNPDNILVLNLFYRGGQWLFQRNDNFSRVQTGGHEFQGVQPFQRWWCQIAFFYRNLQNLLFSRGGGPGSLSPSGSANCLCARVHVYDILTSPKTKHAVSSSKA